jgi:hypothetical protein
LKSPASGRANEEDRGESLGVRAAAGGVDHVGGVGGGNRGGGSIRRFIRVGVA